MTQINFSTYQAKASETALPSIKDDLNYMVMGLCGESGEIANKVKKIIRDKGGTLSQEDKEALSKECGDVLWYLGQVARILDADLSNVALDNLEKLFGRKERGTLSGSGDNR